MIRRVHGPGSGGFMNQDQAGPRTRVSNLIPGMGHFHGEPGHLPFQGGAGGHLPFHGGSAGHLSFHGNGTGGLRPPWSGWQAGDTESGGGPGQSPGGGDEGRSQPLRQHDIRGVIPGEDIPQTEASLKERRMPYGRVGITTSRAASGSRVRWHPEPRSLPGPPRKDPRPFGR